MAKEIKLNVQKFAEGGFDPSRWNNMVSQYDADVPQVNATFVNHQDVLEIFRQVAGSPKLSSDTNQMVASLNESIDETASYFDSVRSWSGNVVDAVSQILGQSIPSVSSVLDRTVLNQINENYNGGFIGVENFSDIETYVSGVQEVISQLRSSLSSVTEAVSSADNSLPDAVHAALSSKVQSNNDAVLEKYDMLNRYLTEHLEAFSQELQGAITDLAAAANGNA